MDRCPTSTVDHPTAVRTAGSATLDLLLRVATGECRELASAPAAGRTVSGVSVLWQPSHGGHAGGQPQAHPATDAYFRNRSSLSETQSEPPGARPRDLPVPAARRLDRAAQPSLEHRYYVCSDAGWLPLPGRGDGLVQPFRAQLGTLQHDGDRLLPGRARSRFSLRPARDLELRSGVPVHLGRISGAAEEAQHLHQHGWTRSRAGQRFHRAPVAIVEVRVDLPRRLRQRGGPTAGAGSLLPLLQSSAPAPGARLPHAGTTVPATVNKEKSAVMMGGSAPQTPRDLALFRPEWMILFFADWRCCRTMERLDRRIGQRRDATRAPTQARNGWRPSGRLLVIPPHHLSAGQILSNLWGPPRPLTPTLSYSLGKNDINSLPDLVGNPMQTSHQPSNWL